MLNIFLVDLTIFARLKNDEFRGGIEIGKIMSGKLIRHIDEIY